MLIFAKDISERSPTHSDEDHDPKLKAYMEYQRKLFPYTVVRAGLDLAYKEVDDILNYIDNDYKKPAESQRENYPDDIPGWYQARFPWTGAFMKMEDMHGFLVHIIRAMDSFRTHEEANTYHWAVLYDTTHNIVEVYNGLLKTNFNAARDIRLSNNVEVDFDDFINNYWPHLEFMILSKPDYPHQNLLARNMEIEDAIKSLMGDGLPPLECLEKVARSHQFHEGTLELMKRDPITPEISQLVSKPIDEKVYEHLSQPAPQNSEFSGSTRLEVEFAKNARLVPESIEG